MLYKISRSCGLNHQDAEDMMQEAHVAAYFDLKKFRQEASYKTWISKILLHKCYHKMNYGNLKYEASNDTITAVVDNNNIVFVQKNSTEKKILNKELSLVLEKSLHQIPLLYRNVFVLREIEKFSVAETAEILEITPVNVKVRLNRAKALLQKEIERFYSSSEIYEFNLIYCDAIVQRIFKNIEELQQKN